MISVENDMFNFFRGFDFVGLVFRVFDERFEVSIFVYEIFEVGVGYRVMEESFREKDDEGYEMLVIVEWKWWNV